MDEILFSRGGCLGNWLVDSLSEQDLNAPCLNYVGIRVQSVSDI